MHNPFPEVPQLDVKSVYEQWKSGEASIVDVREPSEWDLGHIDGVSFIPMGELPRRWQELDPEKKWICVCRVGSRSNYAAAMLRRAGIDASNLVGGMISWSSKKLPITPPGIVEAH